MNQSMHRPAVCKPMRHAATCISVALLCASSVAQASVEEEVRAAFERFVKAQNAHDTAAVGRLLLDSPNFLWITRGTAIWGRDMALQRFAKLYEGTWRLEPEVAGLRVVPISSDVAQLLVPVQFTIGSPGQPPQVTRFLFNQVMVKSGGEWKVSSILPIPAAIAAAPAKTN